MKATVAPIDDFLAALPHARHRLLMLDYDGTLAPFRVARDEAAPYPGVVDLLHGLTHTGTRVVLITGRSSTRLAAMLDLDSAPEIWGVHGLERLFPDGRLERTEIPTLAALALDEAVHWTKNRGFAAFVEVKPGAVALHWRGADESTATGLRLAASAAFPMFARDGRLELREFDGGLELRAPGPHKGDVVRNLLEESLRRPGNDEDVPTDAPAKPAPPASSAGTSNETPGGAGNAGGGPPDRGAADPGGATEFAAAFLGDDFTDEDAFRALRTARDEPRFAGATLLGVLVRADERPTDADARLRPPEALLAFLARWAEATPPAATVAGLSRVGIAAEARLRSDR